MGTPATAVSRPTPTTLSQPPHALAALRAVGLLCVWVAVGCAPQIGDDCKTALDCSAQGSRICDRTQPGGYCTIPNCEQGTCPDESVCVLFRSESPRLSSTYCMYKCSSDSDCRTGDGYECLGNANFGNGAGDALVLDGEGKRFCGFALEPGGDGMLAVPDHTRGPDAGPMSFDDAGTGDAGTGDAGPMSTDDAGAGDAGMGDAGMDDADAGD